MNEPQFDPPLDDTEVTIYGLLSALRMAQAHHRFYDPAMPKFEMEPGGTLDDVEARERVMSAYHQAVRNYRRDHPPPQRDPLPLSELWQRLRDDRELLKYHRAPNVEPIRREPEDLYFNDFAISQRRVDEQQSPKGWLPRSYFVGIPNGSIAFRCIVLEATGRSFCTQNRLTSSAVPRNDDFGLVRVSGTGVNYETGERGPVVMSIYLPTAYGEWSRIVSADVDDKKETIIGYGEADDSQSPPAG